MARSVVSVPKRLAILLAAVMVTLSSCATPGTPPQPNSQSSTFGLYELRVYHAAEGRLADLNARVRDHEAPLFRKHGMTPLAFFTPVVRPGQPADHRLYYILGYKDRAARDEAWRAFSADPAWTKAYKDSQANGSLTTPDGIANIFLSPAEYFPAMETRPARAKRTFELRTYTANPGKLENIHNRFKNDTIRIFKKHGMTNIMYWRPGAGQPDYAGKMVYLMAYPGLAARDQAWRDFAADPEWQAVAAASQPDGPLLKGAPDSILLEPTPYSPLK
jgi:hypothetical protein